MIVVIVVTYCGDRISGMAVKMFFLELIQCMQVVYECHVLQEGDMMRDL
jgi:hypothetical protein